MINWAEVHLEQIFQIYGMSFFIMGVVVFVLPRRDTVLPFASHLTWLAVFGMLHGLLELVDGERLHNSAFWLTILSVFLLATSFISLLEFGRRAWDEVVDTYKLSAVRLYSVVGVGLMFITLWATDPIVGFGAGIRYLVGVPGALLSGFVLMITIRTIARSDTNTALIPWLRTAMLAMITYGVLSLFLSASDPRFPTWLLTTADFVEFTSLPVQLGRALCAIMAAVAFVMIIRLASKFTGETLVRVIDALGGFVYHCRNNRERSMDYMTSGAMQLLGYPAENFLQKNSMNFGDLIHADDKEAFWTQLQTALDQRGEFEIGYRVQVHNGEDCWVYDRGRGVFDSKGELLFIEGHIVDDSERKQAEAELVNYRKYLEVLVEERTYELKNAQGELVRKERLSTLGQLTATVSHELRNPLGAMRPSLYIIKKMTDASDERLQQAVDRIDRNVDRCDHIIDELLDFTRIIELNKYPVQIDEWLESVIEEQNIPQGIQIKKDLCLNDFQLAIDTSRLRRAIINVVDNACHAMLSDDLQVTDHERVHLQIKTRSNDERIEIVITDSGIGIPEAILEKVFEPLFSTKGFGVGLGMSVVKQIMEQHAGGIEIETKEGKGTSVTLWLPKNDAREDLKKGVA